MCNSVIFYPWNDEHKNLASIKTTFSYGKKKFYGLAVQVFSQREPPILDRWIRVLQNHAHVRGIQRDTWNMFLNFCDAIGNDLSVYDDNEAWPSLFDDFVEYENDQTNQNYETNKPAKSWSGSNFGIETDYEFTFV